MCDSSMAATGGILVWIFLFYPLQTLSGRRTPPTTALSSFYPYTFFQHFPGHWDVSDAFRVWSLIVDWYVVFVSFTVSLKGTGASKKKKKKNAFNSLPGVFFGRCSAIIYIYFFCQPFQVKSIHYITINGWKKDYNKGKNHCRKHSTHIRVLRSRACIGSCTNAQRMEPDIN